MQITRRFDTLLLTLFVAGALVTAAAHAATLHTDRFDDGMTLTWAGGVALTGQTTGGPAGEGDGFLQLQSSNHLATHNSTSRWTGDFTSIGATTITVDLMNPVDSVPLDMRVVLFGPTNDGNRWTSSTPAPIPADGVWRPYTFSLAEADLTFVGGSGTYAQMMADVVKVMLRHDPGDPSYGGTFVSATLGVDNVALVGPPSSPPGDYNGDGSVNQGDYDAWVDAFGTVGDSPADGNEDGVVGAADYVFWRNRLEAGGAGSGADQLVIPEPSAFALLLAAMIVNIATRRRI